MYKKLTNFPNFTHLPEKCPNFTLFARKIFSVFFWGGPLAPVSYAYGWTPGHSPAKSGPEQICKQCSVLNIKNLWLNSGCSGFNSFPKVRQLH